jgi:manganese oxidase
MSNRRGFLGQIASIGAGLFAGRGVAAAQTAAGAPVSVETPDVPKLPFRLVNGAKEFHLVAEVVRTEFLPGKEVDAWGYNGSVPGPTIEVTEGDRVRIVFHNNLPEMTTVHWHGLEIPMDMDGVPGLGQDPIQPGGMYTYDFTVNQNGTYFYHSHFAMQEMMGMIGLFIIHPKTAFIPRVDRDFGLILQEWALLPNNTVPNTLAMEFNWLTINGKAGPATTPMLAKQGERIRIRFVNLGMDHHPMHLHGHQFVVTGTEGGRAPATTWFPGNTAVVGVAQARDIEFEAKYVGDWMIHCHLPHHMMNQMVSMVGPMTHGVGSPTGLGMEEGMGVVRQAHALDEDLGPGLGRGLGMAADRERPVSPMIVPVSTAQTTPPQTTPPQTGHEGHNMPGMTAKDANSVPGYPQDMWMPVDEMVADKPEVYGLRKDWTGAMMGMMTLIRVLPTETYDKIMELKKAQAAQASNQGGR